MLYPSPLSSSRRLLRSNILLSSMLYTTTWPVWARVFERCSLLQRPVALCKIRFAAMRYAGRYARRKIPARCQLRRAGHELDEQRERCRRRHRKKVQGQCINIWAGLKVGIESFSDGVASCVELSRIMMSFLFVASSLGGSDGISSGCVMRAAEFLEHLKVLSLGESRRRRTMKTIDHQRLAGPKCRTCSLS